MKWISVKDKLPENHLAVLWVVNVEYGSEILCALYDNLTKTFRWYNPQICQTIVLGPTHWISLPDTPMASWQKKI